MNFLEKLDYLMKQQNLNKNSLSQKCGIPYTTIDAWYKKGYEGLKLTTLRKLSDYFNTTLDYWFLDDITDPNYEESICFKINPDEVEHIKKYRSLDYYGQETIKILLDRECARAKALTKNDTHIAELEAKSSTIINFKNASNHNIYYYYDISAETGHIKFDEISSGQITIPDIPEYRKVAYVIRVSGDSLEPIYKDGDILLVEPSCLIDDYKVGIFNINGEAYVKKVNNDVLFAQNQCMGRIVAKYDPELDAAMNIGKYLLEKTKQERNLADDLIG